MTSARRGLAELRRYDFAAFEVPAGARGRARRVELTGAGTSLARAVVPRGSDGFNLALALFAEQLRLGRGRMSVAAVQAVVFLYFEDGVTVQGLADRLGYDGAASTSRVVGALAALGLVAKVVGADPRETPIVLTPSGCELVERFLRAFIRE